MQNSKRRKGLEKSSPFVFLGFAAFVVLAVFVTPAFCDDTRHYHDLAAQAAQQKQWQDAIAYEQKAYNYNPANAVIKKQLAVYYNNYALALFEKARYDLAIVNFKEALRYDPANTAVKENIYNTTLAEAQKSFNNMRLQDAINLARECIGYDPDRTDAYVFLGNIYYKQNALRQALDNWNKALFLNPDINGLKDMADKATREYKIEENFDMRARTYFDIKFEGERDSELIWDIMDILEDARYRTKSDFGFFTDEKITVIIYNIDQFKQATGKLDWTFGVYDGKIRVKIADVLSDKQFAEKVIYHEYGHAILHILYPNNIPVWLHEGFAQITEPQGVFTQHDINSAKAFLKIKPFKLTEIGALLNSAEQEKVRMGYVLSKLFLKHFIDRYGMYKFKTLLEKLNAGISFDNAIYDVCRLHTEDAESEFVKKFLY